MRAATEPWTAVERHFDRLLVSKRRHERERLERLWADGLEETLLARLLMRRVG